jgi:hypothetical protein
MSELAHNPNVVDLFTVTAVDVTDDSVTVTAHHSDPAKSSRICWPSDVPIPRVGQYITIAVGVLNPRS